MGESPSEIESKNDRFIRLAEQRVNSILDDFRKLGNLSNRKNYDFTQHQVKKIFDRLNKSLRETKALFTTESNTRFGKFKL